MIIACPCAMALAAPTSITVGTGRAAATGVLLRKRSALQAFDGVSIIAVNKTGIETEALSAICATQAHLVEICVGDARPDCPILSPLADD